LKLASCDNCGHRKSGACGLSLAPPDGEFLCHRYVMTTTFREEVVALARREFERDMNQAMIHIAVAKAEWAKAFAG
jgi:hypothetical protein